jgi:lysophospholipase L1-like esterase
VIGAGAASAGAGSGATGGAGGRPGSAGREGSGAGNSSQAGSQGNGSAGQSGNGGASATTGGSGGVSSAGRGGGAGRGGTSAPGGAAGSSGAGGESGSDDGAGGAPNAGLTSFKLVVLGSSTAAGEGASSSGQGWVSLLATSLGMTVTNEFDTDNLAVGGYTTVELMPDSGADGSIDDALDRDPNLVIVALAGNNDLSNGTSTSTYLSRLEQMRDVSVDAGVPIFFVSTAPKDVSTAERETLRDWGIEMKDRFASCWVPERSSAYSPCFIDIFDLLANDSLGVASEYGAGDGIHLNDAGHAVIFEAALEIVEPYVCSMTDCR